MNTNGNRLEKKDFYTKNFLIGPRFEIGEHTYGKPEILTWGEDTRLTIGKYTSIANDVKIFLGGNHRSDWVSMYPFPAISEDWPEGENIKGHPSTKGDVKIGNDAWIGNGTIIMSGITIGNGAVVGAGSVVTKNVPNYAIFAGNPARLIRYRFNYRERNILDFIKWWDWNDEKVAKNVKSLCSGDIIKFIANNKSGYYEFVLKKIGNKILKHFPQKISNMIKIFYRYLNNVLKK